MASANQIAANRRNAQKSTGPKTPAGKAVAKLNAVKHGILSREVVVRGLHIKESPRELQELRNRFVRELAPVGPLEDLLVDQMVTAYWRLRRAVTAETGEITLSVDGGQHERAKGNPLTWALLFAEFRDPIAEMMRSASGNRFLLRVLVEVRQAVARDGELNEATLQEALRKFGSKPNFLTNLLVRWREVTGENPADRKDRLLRVLDMEMEFYDQACRQCEQREHKEEMSRQSASVLPSSPVLDKILRYETTLERQLYRAMNQLERLQRMRRGETIPAPFSVI